MDPALAPRPHQRNAQSVEDSGTATEWSTLLGRMLEDLSRIIRLELQLLEARLVPSLTGMADRAIAPLVILFARLIGGPPLLPPPPLLLPPCLNMLPSLLPLP